MTDLEQQAELAVRLLSPILVYNPSDTYTITGEQMDLLRELIKDQQAEINRLKSGQLKLRPMSEIPKTEWMSQKIIVVDEKSERWFAWTDGINIQVDNLDKETIEFSIKNEGWIGFIDLLDLPTEIEVE